LDALSLGMELEKAAVKNHKHQHKCTSDKRGNEVVENYSLVSETFRLPSAADEKEIQARSSGGTAKPPAFNYMY
jgi:hypothetical protein